MMRVVVEQWLENRPGLCLCYSPSRIYTGDGFDALLRSPKLVAGLDEYASARGTSFYETVWGALAVATSSSRVPSVLHGSSFETVELAKLSEAAYRYVSIVISSQLALLASSLGVSYLEVASLANSQQACHLRKPGLGVGGHCLPEYLSFLSRVGDPLDIFAANQRASTMVADNYVEVLLRKRPGDCRSPVLILGASYRGNLRDVTNSPVFGLHAKLARAGLRPQVDDVYYTSDELEALGLTSRVPSDEPWAIVLQAPHVAYASLNFEDFPGLAVIVDPHQSLLSRQLDFENAGIYYTC